MKVIKFILIVLVIICLYAICCIGLGWFWKIAGSENATQINQVLINLSYSYIAGLIFYLLVSYFPSQIRKDKIRPVIEKKFIAISIQIESNIQAFNAIKEEGMLTNITEQQLTALIQPKSLFENSFFGVEIGINNPIYQLLLSSRKATLERCEEVLTYRDYMQEKEIVEIENIRESNYFRILDIGPMPEQQKKILLDSTEYKTGIITELYKVIEMVRNIS